MHIRTVAHQLDRLLAIIENGLIVILSLIALGLGTMQVTLRYVFNTGFEWNESFFVLTTVTAMLMAGVRAVREDRHVAVDVLPSIMPTPVATVMNHAAVLASLALCLFLAWCGWLFVGFARTMDTVSPETGLKDWIVYSIMPTIMCLFALRYIIRLIIGNEARRAQSEGAS